MQIQQRVSSSQDITPAIDFCPGFAQPLNCVRKHRTSRQIHYTRFVVKYRLMHRVADGQRWLPMLRRKPAKVFLYILLIHLKFDSVVSFIVSSK